MTSFLLYWYSLGWVAMGAESAMCKHTDQVPLAACFLLAPVVIFVDAIIAATTALSAVSALAPRQKQYFWRRP